MSWLKKEEKKIEKVVIKEGKALKKEEEKVVFNFYGYKVKKKLISSIMLGFLVFVIGMSKVESLHEVGKNVSPVIVLVTFVVCSAFLLLTVIKKNIKKYTNQIVIMFIVIIIFLRIITINSMYSSNDILFVSLITTTVASAIYDLF